MLRPPREGAPAPSKVGDRELEQRYQSTLARWTRHAEIYDGLDSRAFVAATFHSMSFREARVARTTAFFALPPAESQALLAVERQGHTEALELLLGMSANERRFDDLARPGSMWRLALVSSAGEVLPLSIDRLPRPDPNLTGLYPYLGPFWTAYRVLFPRTFANGAQVLPQQAQTFVVRLASSLGRVELGFELEAPMAGATVWP
ncbi:MAG: hypothetical protein HY901_15540 [Deltaproteobacteria bacterium]|nr:hypothetical protein [Deltaproteobacteria bacterium]